MTQEEIAVSIAKHENRIRVSEKRIEDLEEREKANQELALSVQKLAISVEQMCKELTLQGQRLAKLEAEPADRWRDVTKQIITLIVAAVTSFVIGKFI
jgi:hypothetical protein